MHRQQGSNCDRTRVKFGLRVITFRLSGQRLNPKGTRWPRPLTEKRALAEGRGQLIPNARPVARSGRWIVWARLERHPRPASSEIGFWAVVSAAIAVAWLAIVTFLVIAAG
jgi:hypothetical protein